MWLEMAVLLRRQDTERTASCVFVFVLLKARCFSFPARTGKGVVRHSLPKKAEKIQKTHANCLTYLDGYGIIPKLCNRVEV